MDLTRGECQERALEWLRIADQGFNVKTATAAAANTYARPAVAASIANVYATLALTAGE